MRLQDWIGGSDGPRSQRPPDATRPGRRRACPGPAPRRERAVPLSAEPRPQPSDGCRPLASAGEPVRRDRRAPGPGRSRRRTAAGWHRTSACSRSSRSTRLSLVLGSGGRRRGIHVHLAHGIETHDAPPLGLLGSLGHAGRRRRAGLAARVVAVSPVSRLSGVAAPRPSRPGGDSAGRAPSRAAARAAGSGHTPARSPLPSSGDRRTLASRPSSPS